MSRPALNLCAPALLLGACSNQAPNTATANLNEAADFETLAAATALPAGGALGVPISITEFDVNLPDEKLQADYLRDFMTIIFANKHVDSFTMWGFWESRHWLPQAALYRSDWSIKPNGQAFRNLLFKQWWTNASGSSNVAGQYRTRGFYGDYKLSVTVNGNTPARNIRLEPGMGEVVVNLS